MEIKEMIEKLRYKANNIKAKIEPEFFNEVADMLEKYEQYKLALYAVVRNNTVMPKGLMLGKSREEISAMTKDVMEELINNAFDLEALSKEYYNQ